MAPRNPSSKPLTERQFQLGVMQLCRREPALAAVVERYQQPPFWQRPPGFISLLKIILEQQVSLASARAAFQRLAQAQRPLTPDALAAADPTVLAAAGLTRQKVLYCQNLASAIVEQRLNLNALQNADDSTVHTMLTQINGIGRWTADIYLLIALRRQDVWPIGDLALLVALQEVHGLEKRPDSAVATALGEPLRPWRSIAVRLYWHQYLSRRGRSWPRTT